MTGELNVGLLLLQASSCMALGLLGSYLWARKPARGHQILLICVVAGVALPGLYIGVQHLGLGQLKNGSPIPNRVAEPPETMTFFKPSETLLLPVDLLPLPDITPTIAIPATLVETEPVPQTFIPWTLMGLGIWGVLSCLVLTRLVWQFVLGLRLIQDRQSVEDDALKKALATAQERVNLNRPVTLCFSPKISSPVIWCWSKTPILLIQDISTQTQPCQDWIGVFCHELAHAKRRDHITNLWMDMLCVGMPWHPLVWWARQRLARLSEDVCDDWVLVQGHASTQYAESLLSLTSQKQLTLMPSIIGKDRPMKERIRRIIKGQISNPRPGTGWTCLLLTVTLCSIVGMALAQPRPKEELRAIEMTSEPIERGVIENTSEENIIDMAVIGRLNVLNRLLEQLTDQARKTKHTLAQAKNDSDRHMYEVELDTLREQIARIETQIQRTKHPIAGGMDLRRNYVVTRTRARNNISNPQAERVLPPASPGGSQGRWIPTHEPGTADVSWRFSRDNAQETEQRVLRTRRKQIEEELKTVEPDLRRRFETGLISTEEFQHKLRVLKNEMGLIDAQLGENAERPKQRLVGYSLKHIPSYGPLRIIGSLIDQVRVVRVTPDSMDIQATPDEHKKIEQLLKELDTPGASEPPRSVSMSTRVTRPTRIASSTTRTAGTRSAAASSSSAPVRTNRLTSKPVSGSIATARPSTGQNLNAEVEDLRGQVEGLNNQMKEMRALLELLVQQKQTEKPTTSRDPF